MFKIITIGLIITSLTFISALANEYPAKKDRRSDRPVKITAVPAGPSKEVYDAVRLRVVQSEAVQRELGGNKYRLMSLEYVDNGTSMPTRFRAVFYDYTNDLTLVAEGDLAGKDPVTIHQEAFQPLSNDDEFNEVVAILQKDSKIAALLKNESLKPFRPMPPTTVLNGTIERLVNIGLGATNTSAQNEIVGVSIKRGEVIHYDKGAPPTALVAPEACGLPTGGNGGSGSGAAQITIMQSGSPLWEVLVQSPTGSSGTNGSGIEIQNVKYKGKLVMKRGHVPVLDVEYAGNACGPYRDWQDEQDSFSVPTTGTTYPNGPTGGIAILADGQIATTILETGNDTGNFKGVAVYRQNNETVMVTEMTAGWYRYIMEWRFADNGIIRPRFGFGATSNSCVCFVHYHHVYWRFDFDIVQPNNKVFQVERGRKFLQPLSAEINRNKNLQTNRSILIQNATGNEAYMLVPNITDGVVDAFGVNDLWVLRYRAPTGNPVTSEIDDGRVCCGGPNQNININGWVNGESLVDQDVVVWYGAHFTHTDGANLLNPDRYANVISGDHVVGPDIRPIRW